MRRWEDAEEMADTIRVHEREFRWQAKETVGNPVRKGRTFGETDWPIETETAGPYFLVSRCDPESTSAQE